MDLGTLGCNQSGANAINQVGDVVGWSTLPGDDDTRFATIWPSGGSAVNLNLLLPEGEAWRFVEARDVNTNRWIVGYGYHPGIGIDQPVLLTPATRVSLGDTDIGVALEDDQFHLHVHHEATDIECEPHHALLHVAPLASRKVPDAPAFAFLGPPGAPTWILPESENPKLLFLGLAAEEIGQGILTANQLQLALKSVDGPGHLALYTVDGFGTPQVHWNSGDGLSDLDTFTLQTGGHQHVNWAFTAPGSYRVGLQASGTLVSGNRAITSEVAVYHFEVVSPEVELTLVRRDASNLTLSTTTKDGVVYQLQSASHTSGPWSPVGQPYVGTGRDRQVSVPITGESGYFRVIPGAGN
ncbi:MAG: choice-of-anchor M domain-containing protein [Limisphaerales bacterium]